MTYRINASEGVAVQNTWALDPEQLIKLVEVLFKGVNPEEWRLLTLLYSPQVSRPYGWVRRARTEFTRTAPQVKWMRENLERRLLRQLVEAYILACEERDGKPPASLDPFVTVTYDDKENYHGKPPSTP